MYYCKRRSLNKMNKWQNIRSNFLGHFIYCGTPTILYTIGTFGFCYIMQVLTYYLSMWQFKKKSFISFIVLRELVRNTYYLTTGNNSSGKTNTKAEKISKKLRKSAEFGFIFQEILFPV